MDYWQLVTTCTYCCSSSSSSRNIYLTTVRSSNVNIKISGIEMVIRYSDQHSNTGPVFKLWYEYQSKFSPVFKWHANRGPQRLDNFWSFQYQIRPVFRSPLYLVNFSPASYLGQLALDLSWPSKWKVWDLLWWESNPVCGPKLRPVKKQIKNQFKNGII